MGIVFLSILCHIWKIVPDLYEAIIRIYPTDQHQTNVTVIPANCSVQPGDFDEVSAIRDYQLKVYVSSTGLGSMLFISLKK